MILTTLNFPQTAAAEYFAYRCGMFSVRQEFNRLILLRWVWYFRELTSSRIGRQPRNLLIALNCHNNWLKWTYISASIKSFVKPEFIWTRIRHETDSVVLSYKYVQPSVIGQHYHLLTNVFTYIVTFLNQETGNYRSTYMVKRWWKHLKKCHIFVTIIPNT